MARVTRLELATLGVTGRYSNQLSYTRVCLANQLPNVRMDYGLEGVKSSTIMRYLKKYYTIVIMGNIMWVLTCDFARGAIPQRKR